MSRPEVTFPDPEVIAVDHLKARMLALGETATVSVGVPKRWKPDTSPPHVSVAWDGTPWQRRHTAMRAAIRVTARAETTSEAKRLALLAQGIMHAFSGVREQLGVMPTRDPDTEAELAWFTVGLMVRSIPV